MLGWILITAFAAACQGSGTKNAANFADVDPDQEEAALRAADLAWSAAAGRKDIEATVAFMAEDGETLAPNESIARGKDAVRKTWTGLMSLPGFEVRWEPWHVEVAASGELGYTSGSYALTFTDDTGRAVTDRGKYVEVWRKIGGAWKCVSDIFNSDLPVP